MRDAFRKSFGYLTAGLFCLAFVMAASSPAGARPWKTTPKGQALDYAQIIDDRGGGNIVLMWWFAPQMIDTMPEAQKVLDRYVVIGAVHGHMQTGGAMNFDSIDTLIAKDGNANQLKLLEGDNIPPTVTGMLAGMEAVLRQSLGPLGQGIRWFVFDGGAVHSCSKGELAVQFADETYTYETPIPGCPAQ